MRSRFIVAWLRINGLVIIAIAIASLIGHMNNNQRLYNWNGSQSGMGLNTALEFLFTGISIFLVALVKEVEH